MTILSVVAAVALGNAAIINDTPAMECTFQKDNSPAYRIMVNAEGRGADAMGLFQVRLWLNGEEVAGKAVPLPRTEARDVALRAITLDRTIHLIALRDDGSAILRQRVMSDEGEVYTQKGECTNYQGTLERWLS